MLLGATLMGTAYTQFTDIAEDLLFNHIAEHGSQFAEESGDEVFNQSVGLGEPLQGLGEPLQSHVAVDAAGQPSANVALESKSLEDQVSEEGADKLLLKMFDQNNDRCVDQAEFIDKALMGPMHVIAADRWPMQHLKGRKLEAHEDGGVWCPNRNGTDVLLSMVSSMTGAGDFGGSKVGPLYFRKICKDGKKNSNTMGASCKQVAKMVTEGLSFPGKVADAVESSTHDMCKFLFPGPCLADVDSSMYDYEKLAIASMAAVSAEGFKTQDLSSTDYAAKTNSQGLYESDHANTPSNNGEVSCGSDVSWGGKYVEKNMTLDDIDVAKIAMGSPTFTPVALLMALQALIFDGNTMEEIMELNGDYKEAPVEASVYIAPGSGGTKGICVVAYQETQGTGSKNFGSDWKMNYNAEMVDFPEGDGKVHKGYKMAYEHLEPIVKTLVESTDCVDPSKVSDILFAGYSAGGGMAVVSYAGAKKTWPTLKSGAITARLVTIGSPPVGDVEFCESHFDDGKALQIVAYDDPYVAMTVTGDVGVIALGALQIQHCTKIKWITCPEDVLAGKYPKKDCHDKKLVYFPWADNATSTAQCSALR
jgi:hypothetical protein